MVKWEVELLENSVIPANRVQPRLPILSCLPHFPFHLPPELPGAPSDPARCPSSFHISWDADSLPADSPFHLAPRGQVPGVRGKHLVSAPNSRTELPDRAEAWLVGEKQGYWGGSGTGEGGETLLGPSLRTILAEEPPTDAPKGLL